MTDIVELCRSVPKELVWANPDEKNWYFGWKWLREAADEIERLRSGRNACEEQFQAKVNQIIGMMDEIERLREALQSTSTLIDVMCKALEVEPEDFAINVKSYKENGEPRLLRTISAQEVLNKARAALGEKE